MYRGSKKLVKTLGYDEEESIVTPLYPIIFKHFNPQKMLYMSLSGYREDFYDFFGEDNKDAYRDKFASRMIEDPVFMTDYYNKGWCYQDYIDTGILYRFFDFSYYQILLYQKYADNFNCPKELLRYKLGNGIERMTSAFWNDNKLSNYRYALTLFLRSRLKIKTDYYFF